MNHTTVLLNEAIDALNIKKNGIYIDCTLGGGGHSSTIHQKLSDGLLISLDQDQFAIDYVKDKFGVHRNWIIEYANFESIDIVVNNNGFEKVDGILYDLGVSSFHFDDEERGFSYKYDATLDMRMDKSKEFSAYNVVNDYSFQDLVKILRVYGEEKFATSITRNILKAREVTPIKTTFELVDIIKSSLPMKELSKKGHPAKKTFQAIRIAVNQELDVLEKSLRKAIKLLNNDGYLVVISFQSLEDRIVKHIFREVSTIPFDPVDLRIQTAKPVYKMVNKKIITPKEEEIINNNRSHSAKMRILKKC
jgi:16S rRNA (cytosine1402-N4)-methyltransferase